MATERPAPLAGLRKKNWGFTPKDKVVLGVCGGNIDPARLVSVLS